MDGGVGKWMDGGVGKWVNKLLITHYSPPFTLHPPTPYPSRLSGNLDYGESSS